MIPLIEKYKVKKLSDIKGQDLAIQEIKNFLRVFPKKRAIILNGPVGIGKTSLAIAIANELNLELFELNASDLRNRKKLEEILRPSIEQRSLFKKGKIILMDEADGITANDRGGLPELIALIEKTSYPIIITSNDIWNRKYSLLRKKSLLINLKELKQEIIINIINEILKKENKKINTKTIEIISKKSRGDVRAALNDLQTLLYLGEEEFISDIYEREKEEDIFNVMKKLFQEPTKKETISIYNSLKMELDEILLWIEENIPREYQNESLYNAYNYLSKADLFKGRVYRQQYWRFLLYQNFFLSAGISSSSKIKTKKFVKYQRPTRILKIWLSNRKNAKKKSIATKYAKITHISKKQALKDFFLISLIIDEKTKNKIRLENDEREYLEEFKQNTLSKIN